MFISKGKYSLALVALVISTSTYQVLFAEEQSQPSAESKAAEDRFRNSLVWFAETNGLKLAILPPAPGSTEISLYAQSVGTNGYWRWVAPTNQLKCKLVVSSEQGEPLQMSNQARMLETFPPRVKLAEYPVLSRSRSSQRYLPLWSRGIVPIDDFDLADYYRFNSGGNFTVFVTPILYDSQPDPIFGQLTEFPSATVRLHLPKK